MYGVVAIAIILSNVPSTWPFPLPILMPHFHKAGGTSMCELLRKSNYNVPKDYVRYNCNCRDLDLQGLLAKKRFSLERAIAGVDGSREVCFVERGFAWPRPEIFHQLIANFTGGLITIMRDPWTRFRSNYEKDYAVCGGRSSRCSFKTVEDFASITFFDTYGGTLYSQPNFYTRMLNGLAGSQPHLVMGLQHLDAAKGVLRKFHAVVFLEQNDSQRRDVVRHITSGHKQVLPRATNNPLSSAVTAGGRSRSGNSVSSATAARQPPNSSHYYSTFMIRNAIDYELYRWAYQYFTGDIYLGGLGTVNKTK